MKIKNRNDGSIESKFEAYRLHQAGLKVAKIASIMGKNRSTIYYRIDLVDTWIRAYKDIKESYQQYVKKHDRLTAIS